MFKKFIEGLMFGGGFTISFVVIWFVAAYFISPMFMASGFEQQVNKHLAGLGTKTNLSSERTSEILRESTPPFHELTLEDQIKNSSVIALAKYERAPDGKMKAIIKEFLKKEPSVTIYYKIGDEYPSAGLYPKERTSYGDGVVIFFVGSPAIMRMSMTYSGDRIHGLGDLPLELLKEKCREPDA